MASINATGRRGANQRRRPFLEGVRVLDFARLYAGSFATMPLGVLGAEVIKVESRVQPDNYRDRWGSYQSVNYCKKSCTLNLRKPEGLNLVQRLVMLSDIVADNFAFGVMERFGLTFDHLQKIKPDIITMTLSGFGQTGPYRGFPAYGPIGSSFAGLDAVTGDPGGPFVTVGGPLDGVCSETLVFGALTALYHWSVTGKGQQVDAAMYEVHFAAAPENLLYYAVGGEPLTRQGNRDLVIAPHGIYPCRADGEWLAVSVSSDQEWKSLCLVLGKESLQYDPRFSEVTARLRHQDMLDDLIANWTRQRAATEATEMLQTAGVPAAPCQTVGQLLNDPHLAERGVFVQLRTDSGRQVTVQRLPGDVNGALPCVYEPAPEPGEDNEYVFKELLGLSSSEYDRLVEEQVIY